MNCNEAKTLIDERVEAERTSGVRSKSKPDSRFKKLDAHLAACATCAAEYQALLAARELTRTVASDTPTDEEIKSMWTAIASAAVLPAGQSVPVDDTTPTWWKTNRGRLLRFPPSVFRRRFVLPAHLVVPVSLRIPVLLPGRFLGG